MEAMVFGDTWTYDGTVWTNRIIPSPSSRRGARIAYDSIRGVAVLFGGNDIAGGHTGNGFNDLWEWNGQEWFQRFSSGPMDPRHSAGFAYDRYRDKLVLVGGSHPYDQGISDTWELYTDCNFNNVSDVIDLSNGTSLDCNFNSIPDECDINPRWQLRTITGP